MRLRGSSPGRAARQSLRGRTAHRARHPPSRCRAQSLRTAKVLRRGDEMCLSHLGQRPARRQPTSRETSSARSRPRARRVQPARSSMASAPKRSAARARGRSRSGNQSSGAKAHAKLHVDFQRLFNAAQPRRKSCVHTGFRASRVPRRCRRSRSGSSQWRRAGETVTGRLT